MTHPAWDNNLIKVLRTVGFWGIVNTSCIASILTITPSAQSATMVVRTEGNMSYMMTPTSGMSSNQYTGGYVFDLTINTMGTQKTMVMTQVSGPSFPPTTTYPSGNTNGTYSDPFPVMMDAAGNISFTNQMITYHIPRPPLPNINFSGTITGTLNAAGQLDYTYRPSGRNDKWIFRTTPEPSSTISFLALGTLGTALILKRKLKPSKSSEKETTKVS